MADQQGGKPQADTASSLREQLSRELEARSRAGEAEMTGAGIVAPVSFGRRLMGRILVRRREVITFYEELALLLECGMPLIRALRGMEARCRNGIFRRVIRDLADAVDQGRSFSQAMGQHGEFFPVPIVAMVRTGEKAGKLDEMLDRIADQAEKLSSARAKVIAELLYPFFVLAVAVAVIAVVFGLMSDGFKAITDIAGAVPWPMQVLMGLGTLFSGGAFWITAAVVVVGVIVLYLIAMQMKPFRVVRDVLLLHIPFVRHFIRQAQLVRFSRVFATLLDSGVSLPECLQASHETAQNEVLRATLLRVQDAVKNGRRVAEEFAKSAIFPGFACDLCDVGEETGTLPKVFHRMADVYEEKHATEVAMVGKIMQPMIIIVLAILVGFIVFAFFSMYVNALQHAPVM